MKENSRRISCVYQLLKANEENFNSKSFGNLAPAMAACRVRKTVRRASPSSLDSSKLYLSVQSLSLSSTEGQQKTTYSGDELWKSYGHHTLQDAWNLVGRVGKIKDKKGYSDKKVVQQDLVNTARKTLYQQGIQKAKVFPFRI